jgi:hypothetical protein
MGVVVYADKANATESMKALEAVSKEEGYDNEWCCNLIECNVV